MPGRTCITKNKFEFSRFYLKISFFFFSFFTLDEPLNYCENGNETLSLNEFRVHLSQFNNDDSSLCTICTCTKVDIKMTGFFFIRFFFFLFFLIFYGVSLFQLCCAACKDGLQAFIVQGGIIECETVMRCAASVDAGTRVLSTVSRSVFAQIKVNLNLFFFLFKSIYVFLTE